jgi:magnesium-transporting ATPase (P-type)
LLILVLVMWRGLQIVLGALQIAVVVIAGFIVWHWSGTPSTGASSIEYKDFVSILLTALALMIAVLAAFLAAAAVYGFQAIREQACRISMEKSEEVAKTTAESVASRATIEYLEQHFPRKDGTKDYGKAAGEDHDRDS